MSEREWVRVRIVVYIYVFIDWRRFTEFAISKRNVFRLENGGRREFDKRFLSMHVAFDSVVARCSFEVSISKFCDGEVEQNEKKKIDDGGELLVHVSSGTSDDNVSETQRSNRVGAV